MARRPPTQRVTRPRTARETQPTLLQFAADRIEQVALSSLRPNPRNARTHGKDQLRRLASAIRRFGFINPIVVDDANMVLAGHARLEAAMELGLGSVPVLRVAHMGEAEKRAYVIADNRLAELAGWNREVLQAEFTYLTDVAVDFDVEVTGFDTCTVDLMLLGKGDGVEEAEPETLVLPHAGPAVSRVGDVWKLGPHRLVCGDARDLGSYELALSGEKAQMVLTDPPYNVPIAGHAQGLGRVRHRDFVMAAGEMTSPEFARFLERIFGHCAHSSVKGSIHYVFMDWRHMREVLEAGLAVHGEPRNLCVWVKTNAGMGSFYRSRHELVFVFRNGNAAHINNFGLGETGRHRSNVWTCPGVNVVGGSGQKDLALHPTVKPVALLADAMRDCSHRNGLVLDPFGGSGSTLMAAEHVGRRAALIELDPAYVDVTVRRYLGACGGKAVLEATGEDFDTVAAKRQGSTDEAPVQRNGARR